MNSDTTQSPARCVQPACSAFVVVAYRYGLRDDHSYVVGVFNDLGLALQAADDHVGHRGGKYGCEVLDCDVRTKTDEWDELPPQIAFIESPYFGVLGRGSQCADMTDTQKVRDSARWFWDESRLPLFLRRVLAKIINALSLRWMWQGRPNGMDEGRQTQKIETTTEAL